MQDWRRAAAASACAIALGATVVAQKIQISGAGATFPVPDLFEVVLRVQQAASERRDQLPVARIRRRHPSVDQPDGVLRRDATADDRRSARGGARTAFCTSRPCWAPSCRRTTCPASRPNSSSRAPSWPTSSSGKITKWNDPAIAKVNPGVTLPNHGHRGRPPVGRQRHDVRLGGLSRRKSRRNGRQRVGVAASVNWPVGVGGQGQ